MRKICHRLPLFLPVALGGRHAGPGRRGPGDGRRGRPESRRRRGRPAPAERRSGRKRTPRAASSSTCPTSDRIVLEVVHPDYYEREFRSGPRTSAVRSSSFSSPLIKQSEEVVVTALRYPEPSIQVPAASTVVSGETLADKLVPNINDGLQDVPGVGALGTAGFSLVPSVRGLARRRVLYPHRRRPARKRPPDGAQRVVRQPRGHRARRGPEERLVGLLRLRRHRRGHPSHDPRSPVSTAGCTAGSWRDTGRRTGRSASAWASRARPGRGPSRSRSNTRTPGLYRAPGGTKVLQSQYTQGSLLAKAAHRTDKREIDISLLAARGTDIGKPNSTAATKPTWYPGRTRTSSRSIGRKRTSARTGRSCSRPSSTPISSRP